MMLMENSTADPIRTGRDNTSQTGTSPLRTIQCILHTCFGMITNQDRPPKTCLSHAGASSGSYLDSWEADHRIQIQNTMRPFLDMQKDVISKRVVKSKL